eukprot:m51a1_g7855 hypothetical protein (376) ;mRNA; f:242044-243532
MDAPEGSQRGRPMWEYGSGVYQRAYHFRKVVLADACVWLHGALHAAGTQQQLQARAMLLLRDEENRFAHDTGVGEFRAWLAQLLCDKTLVEAEEVWPALYERFLAQCRRTGRIVEFPDIDTIVRTAPPAPGSWKHKGVKRARRDVNIEAPKVSPVPDVDKLNDESTESLRSGTHPTDTQRRAALERAGFCGLMIGEYKAELVRYAAVLERETAFVEEIRSHMATVTVELSNATSAHSEALAEAQHSDSAPPGTETEQRMLGAECVLCGDLHELGRTRRLTLCCGHLCCLDCLRSTIPAALSCAVDSDVPLLCPGCAAHRPPAQDVHVDASMAEAVPQKAHAMVDPLALVLTGTGDTAEAVEEEEWLREREGRGRG